MNQKNCQDPPQTHTHSLICLSSCSFIQILLLPVTPLFVLFPVSVFHLFCLYPLLFPFLSHCFMESSPLSILSPVLHRQFTKCGIPSLFFLSLKLSPPFTTQNPKGNKQQKKRRGRELQKRNERLGSKKRAWSQNPYIRFCTMDKIDGGPCTEGLCVFFWQR